MPCFQVPLWVALNLRQRQKCRIVQPEWMTPERLEAARDAERESPFFAELPAPADMFAVAQLVLDVALVDLSNADRVKSLIKDLWDIRSVLG